VYLLGLQGLQDLFLWVVCRVCFCGLFVGCGVGLFFGLRGCS
jgi:hypothetical protein